MSFITLDFETYYDAKYSLTKLSTEEYVNDPRFEIILVGVKVDNNEPKWHTGTLEEIREAMAQYDWANSAVLCHNTLFDAAILEWKLGFKAQYYYDTYLMGKALHGVTVGGSLAALALQYGVGEKGTTAQKMIDRRRESFLPHELLSYAVYCLNDVELSFHLFSVMSVKFPEEEFDLIDMTLKMFLRPQFMVDDALLVERLEFVQNRKQEILNALLEKTGSAHTVELQQKLSSNVKFAQLLVEAGVQPPMKLSPATGKTTYAFAKTDEGFIALGSHEDMYVQELVAARLGTKSTIEESRIEKFRGLGARNRGYLPVPLNYYGAHTGRWSGRDGVNFQNLPSRDKDKKTLKNSLIAPPGKTVINCDSSQIEARVLAWLAGQFDLCDQFRNGDDVYSTFASQVYGRSISKANPIERFVGKTCILGLGYGTGAEKLRLTLAASTPSVRLEVSETKNIVNLYRRTNNQIVNFWGECDRVLNMLMYYNNAPAGRGQVIGEAYIGPHKVVKVTREGIRLPNGLYLRYPGLRSDGNGRLLYTSGRGGKITGIWGGSLTENIVQALARIIVATQLRWINVRYPLALTVHDAGVWIVDDAEVDEAMAFIVKMMSTPPDWCRDLPVTCEAKAGKRYGDC